MKCRNHPEIDAVRTAQMPSADKQPDGSYTEHVPLCEPCADRVAKLGFARQSPIDQEAREEITDEQIVGLVAEHLINVLEAVCASGVDSSRALKCASRALVELDLLDAQDKHRDLQAAPAHGAAMTALEMLDTALATMLVQTPGRIEGFPLTEMFGQGLAAVRSAVEQHWKMLEQGGGPRIITPGENGFRT